MFLVSTEYLEFAKRTYAAELNALRLQVEFIEDDTEVIYDLVRLLGELDSTLQSYAIQHLNGVKEVTNQHVKIFFATVTAYYQGVRFNYAEIENFGNEIYFLPKVRLLRLQFFEQYKVLSNQDLIEAYLALANLFVNHPYSSNQEIYCDIALGKLYLKLGDGAKAFKHFSQAIQIPETDIDVPPDFNCIEFEGLGLNYKFAVNFDPDLDANYWELCEETFSKLITLPLIHLEAKVRLLVNLVVVAKNRCQWDDAIFYLAEILKLCKENSQMSKTYMAQVYEVELSLCYAQKDNWQEVVKLLDNFTKRFALKLKIEFAPLYHLYLKAFYKLNQMEKATETRHQLMDCFFSNATIEILQDKPVKELHLLKCNVITFYKFLHKLPDTLSDCWGMDNEYRMKVHANSFSFIQANILKKLFTAYLQSKSHLQFSKLEKMYESYKLKYRELKMDSPYLYVEEYKDVEKLYAECKQKINLFSLFQNHPSFGVDAVIEASMSLQM